MTVLDLQYPDPETQGEEEEEHLPLLRQGAQT